MHVQTVYEIPRHTFPIELLFDIAFIIVAIGLISQAISSFRRQKLNIWDVVGVFGALVVATIGTWGICDIAENGLDPYAKAYYAGEYEILEGICEDFKSFKVNDFYIGDNYFYYPKGQPIENGSKVRVYYIDLGEGEKETLRVDIIE
ncbi:hypothetical protein V1225_08725 [Emergencia sp. JLR.KK010]|uniref:hypothetical protein n=1 Tax=Emergencia sp. JLR.KK010 TaxID=3114296 RepID=UPI00203B00C6